MEVTLKPVLIVDARKLAGTKTGVGHYTYMITERLRDTFDLVEQQPTRWSPLFHAQALMRCMLNRRARYFSPESLIVPAILGQRSVVVVHDITPITHPSLHTRRNLIFHKLLLGVACRRVGRVLVPTEAVSNDLHIHVGVSRDKIRVTGEGQRLDFQDIPPIEGRPLNALYVGTIEPRKNVNTLIRAFLEAATPGWTLVIAGRLGWLTDDEKEEFDKLTAADNVRYLSYVSDEQLINLYTTSSLFIYPSSAEGFGLPPLEAMAAGTPVITTNDPAIAEVVGEAARVVPLASLEVDLARAIEDLITNPSVRAAHSRAGRDRATRFSWQRAASLTREALLEVEPRRR